MPEWMKERLRSDRGEARHNPSRTRKILLSTLKSDEWTGFIGLSDLVDQSAEQTGHVLDFLEERGRIEKTPLYFLSCDSKSLGLDRDRTVRPVKDYQGFEFGYRRIKP